VRDGHRVSTNDAYLEVARSRSNLTIRGDTSVERVVIDGTRAVGVLTVSGDQIDAGEVIISAGAIHSPAILLRSGIGPEIGRPVGENLIEHPGAPLNLSLKEGARIDASTDALLSTMVRYSSGLADAGENDMQIFPLGATFFGPVYGALTAAVMRVFSRGRVSLKSMDANDDPVVEFRMLSDERDTIRLRDGVRRLLAFVEHPAIAAISTEVSAGANPLAALDSDEAIDEWLRANVSYYGHAVGTCRMGAAEDPSAVVDPRCRVIGFERLRVVDASVMPDIPRANTHLTTVAVAEHVAAMMTSEPD
jgi:choline dehydrogenase-like flavoprotein